MKQWPYVLPKIRGHVKNIPIKDYQAARRTPLLMVFKVLGCPYFPLPFLVFREG